MLNQNEDLMESGELNPRIENIKHRDEQLKFFHSLQNKEKVMEQLMKDSYHRKKSSKVANRDLQLNNLDLPSTPVRHEFETSRNPNTNMNMNIFTTSSKDQGTSPIFEDQPTFRPEQSVTKEEYLSAIKEKVFKVGGELGPYQK